MSRTFSVAVVGATGLVGREMVRTLEQRRFPVGRLRLWATARSAGSAIRFDGRDVAVEALADPETAFSGTDFVLMSAGAKVSQKVAPVAGRAAIVIDNSSAWRMDPRVPLVVPEVNPEAARTRPIGVIANPNCSTIQMVVALKPLHDAARLTRVVVSTYQAISGAGARALAELADQTRAAAAGEDLVARALPFPALGNLLFHDVADPDGSTEEELKMVRETRRILGIDDLPVAATCVRVPVAVAHSEAVWAEFAEPLSVERARALLAAAPGVRVVDDPGARVYPRPRDAAGRDEVFVGRIRKDPSARNGLAMWVVADNLRKGAALNAVQIAEGLIA